MHRVLMDNPEYREIPGIPGYTVSEDGRVRSSKKRGRRRCRNEEEYEMALTPDHAGYLGVKLYHGGKIHRYGVHILVLMAFGSAKPKHTQCRHLNGNYLDNRRDNLAWGTVTENANDRVLHGTQTRGETVGTAVLDEEKVRTIRRRFGEGATILGLSKEFNVARTTIKRAVKKITWAHVV